MASRCALRRVVDIAVAQDMEPRRQRADAQPVAAVQDDGTVEVGTEEVAAGVTACVQLAGRLLDRRRGARASEQFAGQQAATAWLVGQLRLGAVGHGHEDAMLVDPEPGAADDGVEPRHRPRRAVEELGWQSAARIRLLAVGAQRPEGHRQRPERRSPAGTCAAPRLSTCSRNFTSSHDRCDVKRQQVRVWCLVFGV